MGTSLLRFSVALACALAGSLPLACDGASGSSADVTADGAGPDAAPDITSDVTGDVTGDLSGDSGPDAAVVTGDYARCDASLRTGGFVVALRAKTTTVQGGAASGVVPADVATVSLDDGTCRLLRPPALFCEPACAPGQACTPSGGCITYPAKVSIGTVTITGLSAPVEMKAVAPTQIYYFAGDLPHPGFGAGDPIGLSVAGPESVALSATGVAALVATTASMPMVRDQPGVLKWVAPPAASAARMLIELNIANHGGTPGRVECLTDDDGEFEIPAQHINALLDLGYSGFPSVTLSRHTADAAQMATGCFDLVVESAQALSVAIEGLTSCSSDDDCDGGQVCGPDLTCGDVQ